MIGPRRRGAARAAGLLALALLAPAAAPERALAQSSPLILELRGGGSLPVAAFGEAQGRPNTTLGAAESLALRFELSGGEPWAVVLGFSQERARCEGRGCGREERWISTAWAIGARWLAPPARARPWLSAALVIPSVEWELDDARRRSDTALGLEVGAGLRIALGERWSTGPAVRYARHDAEFRRDGRWPVRWIALEWAVAVGF